MKDSISAREKSGNSFTTASCAWETRWSCPSSTSPPAITSKAR